MISFSIFIASITRDERALLDLGPLLDRDLEHGSLER